MTDPVDTEALRQSAQFLHKAYPGTSAQVTAAADELDRLRAVELATEGALAEQQRLADENKTLLAHVRKMRRDGAHRPSCEKNSGRRYARCTCWKANVT